MSEPITRSARIEPVPCPKCGSKIYTRMVNGLQLICAECGQWSSRDEVIVAALNERETLIAERDTARIELAAAQAENARLLRGDFTAEEFQNLCHGINGDNQCAFFKGCTDYQKQLFGSSAIDDFRTRVLKLVRKKAEDYLGRDPEGPNASDKSKADALRELAKEISEL